MRDPDRKTLAEVMVCGSICAEHPSAADINADRTHHHLENGSMLRLPDLGLTKSEVAGLRASFLRGECCQEDHGEMQECGTSAGIAIIRA